MLGVDWSRHCGRHSGESAEFSPDISPVILAATCNQFEILQLLLSRGATIERPHQLSCGCDRCKQLVRDDSLRHSLLRINTYRALASPAWICLTSSDPILTAFRLSWELQRLASRENEFKEVFVALSQQCRKYACDLLDQCRSSEEVIAVLNKSKSADDDPQLPPQQPPVESLSLDRLKLALKFEQKQFVAHSHCQQLLTTIWYDRMPGWRKQPLAVKALMCFGFVLMMPVLALVYVLFPRSRLGQLMRSPFMKFLNHSASFAIFLVLLLIASTDWGAFKRPKERYMVRGPPPDLVETLILWWVLGFVWAEMKQIWEEGFQAYVRQWWNWLDFIMLALYLTTLALRLAAFTLARTGKYGAEPQSRLEWPVMDPTLLSEAVFSIANVFSFARIIFLFQVNEHLGPLQISLGCMVIDIAKFIFIFYLVITSFACGLNQLYFYYAQDHNIRNDGFATLTNSYQTLFWSLFGVTNRRDVIIQSASPTTSTSSGFGEGRTTEVVAELMLLTYHFVAIIVLVNMLIAMMSSSFQNI
uniref:ANK_REP_REGION domain-containing protein n=1 Tax=Macrostomum lignano TaxID=282301 RepID=A0A1I8JHK4_9PLAT